MHVNNINTYTWMDRPCALWPPIGSLSPVSFNSLGVKADEAVRQPNLQHRHHITIRTVKFSPRSHSIVHHL
jgi:hypothetical protein